MLQEKFCLSHYFHTDKNRFLGCCSSAGVIRTERLDIKKLVRGCSSGEKEEKKSLSCEIKCCSRSVLIDRFTKMGAREKIISKQITKTSTISWRSGLNLSVTSLTKTVWNPGDWKSFTSISAAPLCSNWGSDMHNYHVWKNIKTYRPLMFRRRFGRSNISKIISK